MNWRDRLAVWSPGLLAAISLWLPWVWDRSAALVLTGLDLPEFVRFVGGPSAALARPSALAFAAPLLAAGVGLTLLAAGRPRCNPWEIGAALVVGGWLASVAFPPLEQGAALAMSLLLLGLVTVMGRLLTSRARVAALIVLASGLVSAGAALTQLGRMAPVIAELYGHPLTLGAGVYLAAVSAVGAGVGLVWTLWRVRVSI